MSSFLSAVANDKMNNINYYYKGKHMRKNKE